MVIACGSPPPLRYVEHRKSTINPRTMQIIRGKNANSLKFIPILGGAKGDFSPLYICNEMKYIEYIYYFLYVMQKQCNCIENLCICIENRCICMDVKYHKCICITFALHLECICIEMVCICIKKRCICIALVLHVHFI